MDCTTTVLQDQGVEALLQSDTDLHPGHRVIKLLRPVHQVSSRSDKPLPHASAQEFWVGVEVLACLWPSKVACTVAHPLLHKLAAQMPCWTWRGCTYVGVAASIPWLPQPAAALTVHLAQGLRCPEV